MTTLIQELDLPPVVNPLWDGLRTERTSEPCTFVVFGATGDLNHRKLMPALYNLALSHRLPHNFNVVGFARREGSDEKYRQDMRTAVEKFSRQPLEPTLWESFEKGIFYHQSNFDDLAGYESLAKRLDELDKARGTIGNRIFYLSTPPEYYPVIIAKLGASGLNKGGTGESGVSGWSRVIIEKPFGIDLNSARSLNREVMNVFRERQVFRIDHYLGKETVQNILVFRFANGMFEPIWNRNYIDHVQITNAESLGVEGRVTYYEGAGALRDMIQNHMSQVLAFIAMEPPTAFEANAVRDEKVKVVRAIKPLSAQEVEERVIRGQYGAGAISGQPVPGYRRESQVNPQSTTETFVAMKLFVDNWRWAGVPFYIRTGKRMPKRGTEVSIQFKPAPHLLFNQTATGGLEPNVLTLHIQPDEGISIRFGAKVPGPTVRIRTVNMEFRYGASFGEASADAYERLILDCLLGDATLFTRRDEVEAAWTYVNSILDAWKVLPAPRFPNYESGTWGPKEAHDLLARDGRAWRRP